jgi:hypothetical protein
MSFYKDLAFGQIYEKLLCKILNTESFELCNTKDYDVKLIQNGIETFYEVKTDRYTHKTNNICIEYLYKGHPSGISSTKADYYAYFVVKPNKEYDVYIVPVTSILRRIRKEKYKRIVNIGDKNMSTCYLFDKQIFEKFLIKNV